jgi:preprotein translocase subunit SecG
MLLRKINAVLGLFTTVLLMDHAIFFSVWMLSRCSIEKSADFMPRILAVLMVLHAILSIILLIKNHKGAEKNKHKKYSELNIETYVQRITGVLIILMMGLHIAGAANHFQPKILHAILHPLFFAVALAHCAVSVDKAFITLGIGSTKFIRVVNVAMKIICCATLVAGVIGFYICLFVGVAR